MSLRKAETLADIDIDTTSWIRHAQHLEADGDDVADMASLYHTALSPTAFGIMMTPVVLTCYQELAACFSSFTLMAGHRLNVGASVLKSAAKDFEDNESSIAENFVRLSRLIVGI